MSATTGRDAAGTEVESSVRDEAPVGESGDGDVGCTGSLSLVLVRIGRPILSAADCHAEMLALLARHIIERDAAKAIGYGQERSVG
jgi:hypothetical protein